MSRKNGRSISDQQFTTLEVRVDHVSDAAVRKKWKKLAVSSHGPARSIIQSAKIQPGPRKGVTKYTQRAEEHVLEMSNM